MITAAALVVGVPLFLRSPPWCDITLYQLAARNLLHGGVHYRDLFDTNLPGFVWAMTALYAAFGANVIAVRVADLLIVLGVVLLIDRLAKWGGATPAARWWALAGAALFYPFTVEMSHAQRDTWMALPGLAALLLRARRGIGPCRDPRGGVPRDGIAVGPVDHAHVHVGALGSGGGGRQPGCSPFRASFLEGLLWGAGVWMKPHIALMALVVWLLTARRLAGEHPRPWRAAALDLLGNLLGGAAAGAPGLLWLVGSGAWGAFYEVFTEWNPLYMKLAQYELPWRVSQELYWFPVWSLGLIVTVPLALVSVLDAAFWSSRAAAIEPARPGPLGRWLPRHLWDKQAGADARFVRGLLGALYLTWVAQSFFVQRGFQYAHVPETLLMIGLWASHRWSWVPVALMWLAVASGLWVAADFSPDLEARLKQLDADAERAPGYSFEYLLSRQRALPRHPATLGARLRLWPECWRLCMPDKERYALWDKLRLHPPHEASISWEEMGEVADFLREQGARDGEVLAWYDSPHAAYLLLDVEPGFRFMHVYTALSISVTGETGAVNPDTIPAARANARRAKYAISDLEWVALSAGSDEKLRQAFIGPAHAPPGHLLPTVVPYPDEFPFNQPAIFRSHNNAGRYVVHRIVAPEKK